MAEIIVDIGDNLVETIGCEFKGELVRCKECKYWKWIEWAKESRCTLRNTAFNARADDYCSYGEREGE